MFWRALLAIVLFTVACGGKTTPPGSANALVTATPAVVAEGQPRWQAPAAPVPVTDLDPSWGSASAPVTVVVFSDLQCPFCQRLEANLQTLRTKYGPSKLRIVWKNEPLPFHKHARPAAELLMGVFALAGNEAFWRVHTSIFANQRELDAEAVVRWAAEAGVDVGRLRQGYERHEWSKKIDDDHREAARVGVTGTPGSFVNGLRVSGAMPAEYFAALIDDELEKTDALRAQGIPATEWYGRRTATNFTAQPVEEEHEEPEDKTVYYVPIDGSPVRGNANAQVTLVVFSDIQCPFCRRVESTFKTLQTKFGDKLRIVWKDMPLPMHEHARRAAIFTREARAQQGDAGFWRAHDKLFELAPDLDKPALTRAAADLQLNLGKIQAAVRSGKYEKGIAADTSLAHDLHADGTPHSFLNGRRLSGAQPVEKFAAIIEEEIKKTDAMMAAGTAPSAVYTKLMESAKRPPDPERVKVSAPTDARPRRGGANAKVVITEFADFQCPFCVRVEKTLDALLQRYGNSIAVVARDLPLPMHPEAPAAAAAAREAFAQKGNAGYWKMRELLYANQNKLQRTDLEAHAQAIGLDLARFRAALDSGTHKSSIDADAAAADAAQITGTPAFVINGYLLSGAQPEEAFRKLIERALGEAGVAIPKPSGLTAKGETW